jgi:hypothetical protein
MDLVLPAPTAVTGDNGESLSSGEKSADDRLRRLLGVSEMDPRPVLLYFHYPHEEDERLSSEGRISKKQCGSVDEEKVARWCLLYRCYEVDMGRSDRKSAERLGAGPGTSFAVVNWKLEAVAKSGPMTKPEAVMKFLEDGLRVGFADYWKDVAKRIDEQKALLAEARKLADKKDWKAAKERYDQIRTSEFRVYDDWDDAVTEANRVTDKAAKEAK